MIILCKPCKCILSGGCHGVKAVKVKVVKVILDSRLGENNFDIYTKIIALQFRMGCCVLQRCS